jgi:hypothetical protein
VILGNYGIKFHLEDEVDLWRSEDGIVNIVIVGDVGENIMISDNGVYELLLFK